MSGVLGIATYNKCAYAALHGYSCVADKAAVEHQEGRPAALQRHAVWGKINTVQAHLPAADWLVWMDLDVVVTNWAASISRIVNRVSSRTDLIMFQPTGDSMINAGLFLVRAGEWSSWFFDAVQARTDLYLTWPYEQQAMFETAADPTSRGHVETVRDDHVAGTLCGFSEDPPCRWRRGDWTLHFAPPRCPRAAVMESAHRALGSFPDPFAPVLVTGASANHGDVALHLLDDMWQHNPAMRVIFWDLGLT